MLLVTLKRTVVSEMLGALDSYEQLTIDAPEVEARLRRGGVGEMGCDATIVVCVDIAKEESDDA